MDYVKAADIRDLPAGSMIGVMVAGQKVLIANVNGELHAMQQRCPHMGGNLCKGKLEGAKITCPWHGATFDVTTGAALRRASWAFLKMNVRNCKTYPVRRDGHDIWFAFDAARNSLSRNMIALTA